MEFEYAVIGLDSYLHKETQSYVGGTAYAKTVTKTFDANGNKVSETYPSGSNLSLAYAYNDVDALASVSDGTNTVASYTWVGVREKDTTFQSGAKRKNVYTGFRGELESVRHETGAGATLLRLDYGYDKNHDRLYERYGAAGSAGDAFAYDKARRLTTAWMGSATPSAPSGAAYTKKIDYNYDDDGNRTSVVTTPYQQSPSTTSYTTNNLYEYTSVGGVTHGWDLSGNLTDNGTYKFKYNYKNLVCEVLNRSTNALVASYRYDALGNRVEKNVGGTVERYVLSKAEQTSNGIACWHVVATFDGSNAWRQNFVYGDAIDGLVMLEQRDVLDYDSDGNTTEVTRHFYHVNALGSVMALSDMNQAVAVGYRYEPYGKVTITRNGQTQTTDPLGQHFGFTGRFLDEESGLLYYRARYYDPNAGRFCQRDPLGFAIAANPFEYVNTRPTALIDPLGLEPITYPASSAPQYTGVHIVLNPVPVASGPSWTSQEINEWRNSFLRDLLDRHEFVHAKNMGRAWKQTRGRLQTKFTGNGAGKTEAEAKRAAYNSAMSSLNSYLTDLLDELYEPELEKDRRGKMPRYAKWPSFAYTSGVVTEWSQDPAVAAVMNARGWRRPPLAFVQLDFSFHDAKAGDHPGRIRIEAKYDCHEFWSGVFRRPGGGLTCSSRSRFWHCECELTVTWPKKLQATVTYPAPDRGRED